MSAPDIVVLGNANVDLTTYVEHAPAEGETVIGHDFTIGMGGKGANQAVAAARAGSKVAFIGRRGDDAFGDLIQSSLSEEGLHLEHLGKVPGPSGNATIYVEDNGANMIAVFPGASATLTPNDVTAAVKSLSGARYFVSQLEMTQEIVLTGLRAAGDEGMIRILNTAPYSPLIPGIAENTDWLIANEVEMEDLLSEAGVSDSVDGSLEKLEASIPQWSGALGCNLVVTLGSKGAVGFTTEDGAFFAESPEVNAVDTVGAGDCFVGYFVSLMSEDHKWQGALRGAVAAASESVQHPGAQSSYPPRTDADTFRKLAKTV
jgi:ribokinase